MNWRPTKTIPMDGTDILVALHPEIAFKKGKPVDVMHYEERPLLGKTWTAAGGDWSCGLDCVVGWMPLDDLPAIPRPEQ